MCVFIVLRLRPRKHECCIPSCNMHLLQVHGHATQKASLPAEQLYAHLPNVELPAVVSERGAHC
jgi:hypothetical protein